MRENCQEEIKVLLKNYTMEELAGKCGVGYNCMYKWSKGGSVPMLAAKKLKDMVKQGGC